jgi:inorganic pyrophosphatase
MIGQIVEVKIERKIGSFHPQYQKLQYPINYGYIEGIVAGDGEEQDAYVIGVEESIDTFIGEVIAIVHRNDDVEEKYVVAPKGSKYTKKEIEDLVSFQEIYFDSYIKM